VGKNPKKSAGAEPQKKRRPPRLDFDEDLKKSLDWIARGEALRAEWSEWDEPVAQFMVKVFDTWLKHFRERVGDLHTLYELEKKRDAVKQKSGP